MGCGEPVRASSLGASLPYPRLLVFDEDMPQRLSTEIGYRGRSATRVSELQLKGTEDPDLIAALIELHPDCVLVTGNYWMPAEHVDAVRQSSIAIATIDPRRAAGYTQDSWRRDVSHRWIHSMQLQRAGSLRRYAIASSGSWAPNIRA